MDLKGGFFNLGSGNREQGTRKEEDHRPTERKHPGVEINLHILK
jgi:hypothetical protein